MRLINFWLRSTNISTRIIQKVCDYLFKDRKVSTLIFVYLNILKSNLYYYYNCSVVNIIFEVANSKIRIRDIGLESQFTVAIVDIVHLGVTA